MRISAILTVVLGTALVNTAFAAKFETVQRDRVNLLSVNRKADKCERKYPLISNGAQQIAYAFQQYGISPDLTPPPPDYLEVSITAFSLLHVTNGLSYINFYEFRLISRIFITVNRILEM